MLSYDPKSLQLKQSFLKDEKFYQFPEPTMQTLFGLDIALRLFTGSFAELQSLRSVNQTCRVSAHASVLSLKPRPRALLATQMEKTQLTPPIINWWV